MNRFKLLSSVLGALLVVYSLVSAAVYSRMRDDIEDAESRCKLLESRGNELVEQGEEAIPEVAIASHSRSAALAELQETLQFREMELADLSKAYASLQADYEALQERMAQMPGANLPPEAIERRRRFRERFADADPALLEEMRLRRQERVQGFFDMMQERIDNAPNESIRQNLLQVADSLGALNDMRQQLHEAVDEETRGELWSALRDEGANLQRLVREERSLELAQVASHFGIEDPQAVQSFVDAVESVNAGPLQQLSEPRGMPFGGRGRPGP